MTDSNLQIKGILLLTLAISSLATAQSGAPKPGQSYQQTRIDLNRDGHKELVGLRCQSINQGNWYSRLTVWDDQGRITWQSMPSKRGVWAFGGWDWGLSDLQLVADIDGDGQVEAISPEPVSDVSPVTFRIYRWSGQAFTYLRSACLSSDSQDHFSWGGGDPNRPWIGKLQPGPGGVVWSPAPGGEVQTRTVRLRADARGFQVVR